MPTTSSRTTLNCAKHSGSSVLFQEFGVQFGIAHFFACGCNENAPLERNRLRRPDYSSMSARILAKKRSIGA